jgi:hypothetical protein
MTVEPGWVPPEVDTTKANVARVYDYWVGGDHNFQADRDLARTITALDPHIRTTMRANRAFLGRVVRYLAGEVGIRQFLDIGSGIPTENNVHQVAQEPEGRRRSDLGSPAHRARGRPNPPHRHPGSRIRCGPPGRRAGHGSAPGDRSRGGTRRDPAGSRQHLPPAHPAHHAKLLRLVRLE